MSIQATRMGYEEQQGTIEAMEISISHALKEHFQGHVYKREEISRVAAEAVAEVLKFEEAEIVIERYVPPAPSLGAPSPPTSKRTYLRLPWEA